jgi:hypothetical protein
MGKARSCKHQARFASVSPSTSSSNDEEYLAATEHVNVLSGYSSGTWSGNWMTLGFSLGYINLESPESALEAERVMVAE